MVHERPGAFTQNDARTIAVFSVTAAFITLEGK